MADGRAYLCAPGTREKPRVSQSTATTRGLLGSNSIRRKEKLYNIIVNERKMNNGGVQMLKSPKYICKMWGQ